MVILKLSPQRMAWRRTPSPRLLNRMMAPCGLRRRAELARCLMDIGDLSELPMGCHPATQTAFCLIRMARFGLVLPLVWRLLAPVTCRCPAENPLTYTATF